MITREYKITCVPPKGEELTALFTKLPSPISRPGTTDIYSYRIEKDGIYFIDRLVSSGIAAIALKAFLDAALANNQSVTISEG